MSTDRQTQYMTMAYFLDQLNVPLSPWQREFISEYDVHVSRYVKVARNRTPWRFHVIVAEGEIIPWTHSVAYFDPPYSAYKKVHAYPVPLHLVIRFARIVWNNLRYAGWRWAGVCPVCKEPLWPKEPRDNCFTRAFWRTVDFVERKVLFPIKSRWRNVSG